MIFSLGKFLKLCLAGIAILYPIVIFLAFVVFDAQLNHISLFIVIFSILYLIINLTNEEKRKSPSAYVSPVVLFLIGSAGFFLNSSLILKLYPELAGRAKDIIKLYPLLVNTAWLFVFGTSLFFPPSFVFEIALLIDKSIKGSAAEQPMEHFSRRATIVWCLFFALDSIVAWFTIFGPLVNTGNERLSDTIWGIYNGAVTYFAMGIILVVQFVMAKRLIKKSRAGYL
ncbi:MAG: hypothetical protein LBD22_07000 [Spirochaetaceae bacterium]|nr:hypothetical protein [Spirochaetaceae bacterium]